MRYLYLLILFCISLPVRSQSYRDLSLKNIQGEQEFNVSAGLLSGRQIVISLGAENGPDWTSATPCYFISYKYFFFDWLGVGLTAGTQTIWGNSEMYDNPPSDQYTYELITYSAGVECTFMYPKRGRGRFVLPYGGAAFGVTYSTERDHYVVSGAEKVTSQYLPSFHITPIGIRIGGAFAGFIELGLGFKGCLRGGFMYRFPEKPEPFHYERPY